MSGLLGRFLDFLGTSVFRGRTTRNATILSRQQAMRKPVLIPILQAEIMPYFMGHWNLSIPCMFRMSYHTQDLSWVSQRQEACILIHGRHEMFWKRMSMNYDL